MDNENVVIDHEVRIRALEDHLNEVGIGIETLREKIDAQFNLILGTIVTSCIGVALHMSRLL